MSPATRFVRVCMDVPSICVYIHTHVYTDKRPTITIRHYYFLCTRQAQKKDLKGSADFFGINHYATNLIQVRSGVRRLYMCMCVWAR